jgi:hypothetical protein
MQRTRKVFVWLFITSMLVMTVAFAPASSAAETAATSEQDGPKGILGKPLVLASDGTAMYEIVVASDASAVDQYAAGILADYLGQMTQAQFPVVTADAINAKKPSIYVGLSTSALQKLRTNPLAVLEDQEHVSRSIGKDIYLYGKGLHGNLYAVMDFLENSLGWRWFSNFEQPVFTVDRNLALAHFNRSNAFSFQYRMTEFQKIFDYQQGINMGFSERQDRVFRLSGVITYPDGVESLLYNPEFVHATPNYIPPTPTWRTVRDFYEWVTNRYYWSTNPEFFSMKSNGQRTPEISYCFSNPGLRDELTANIMEHLRRLREQGIEDALITVDTHDGGGKLCYCPECLALEEAYATPGGALFDYLIELCAEVAAEYPQARIKTGASRVEKTAIAPTLPEGVTWPDNLVVIFANISDKLDRDWNAIDNSQNYQFLQDWLELTPHVWTWYYPNPYGLGQDMPFAGIRRQVSDLRKMYEMGVEGVFFEFTTPNVHKAEGFVELQKYVYYNLMQDINQDEQVLITEFTDSLYGDAAPLVRQYLEELEDAHEAAIYRVPLTILSIDFETTLAYITTERLMRWHGYFDAMEALAADDAHRLENVQRLRRNIELATLGRWHAMNDLDPVYFDNYEAHIARTGPHADSQLVADFVTIIQAGKPKPLPEPFNSLPEGAVVRYMPTNYSRGSTPKIATDETAAFGYAATIDLPDNPFFFGYAPRVAGMDRVEMSLTNDDITPDEWVIYHLGLIEVMPDPSIIYFSNASWMTHLLVGQKLYVPKSPDNDNMYDVYISLKFSGASYGGTGDTQVLCDQIILVRQMALDN